MKKTTSDSHYVVETAAELARSQRGGSWDELTQELSRKIAPWQSSKEKRRSAPTRPARCPPSPTCHNA